MKVTVVQDIENKEGKLIGKLGEERTVSSIIELEKLTRQEHWSPYLFKREQQLKGDGNPYKLHRNIKNFIGGYFFAIDIDNKLTIQDAVNRVKATNLKCFINTTRNHQINGNGDRFRVVFELSKKITTTDEVYGTFLKLKKLFPELDEACKDSARYFAKSKELVGVYGEWSLEPEVVASKAKDLNPSALVISSGQGFRLSLTTEEFLNNYIEHTGTGSRHKPLVSACLNAGTQGWTKDAFKKLLNYELNPWLKEERYQDTINDVFDNRRWGNESPNLSEADSQKQLKLQGPALDKWVYLWLRKNKALVTYDGLILLNKTPLALSDIMRKIRLDLFSLNAAFSVMHLEDCITQFISDNRDDYLKASKKLLNKYNPEGFKDLDKFVKAMQGSFYTPLTTKVMEHFIWCVKRRLNDLETVHEIMPVFVGGQGIGKSYNIKNGFLAPLNDLAKTASFKQISDERELRLVTDNFVLLFDEMAYANKSDINNIKRLISETKISIRRMRETTHDLIIKKAQFIGTSNNSLLNSIADPTGMRRFYEVLCENRERDFSVFKELNYTKMWHSVDHKKNSPIYEVMDELIRLYTNSDRYVEKDPLTEWIYDSGLISRVDNKSDFSNATILLENFNKWYNGPRYSSTYFGRKLKDVKGVEKERKKTGVFYNLKLNILTQGDY